MTSMSAAGRFFSDLRPFGYLALVAVAITFIAAPSVRAVDQADARPPQPVLASTVQ